MIFSLLYEIFPKIILKNIKSIKIWWYIIIIMLNFLILFSLTSQAFYHNDYYTIFNSNQQYQMYINFFQFTLMIFSFTMLLLNQYTNKKNKETNKIQQLRNNIVPKLRNLNKSDFDVQIQSDISDRNYTSLQEIFFKTQDQLQILSLQLKDRLKFKYAFSYLLRYKLRKLLNSKNIIYPKQSKDEDKQNFQLLEMHQNIDEFHTHFKSQYNLVQSVILEQIVQLQDYQFLNDLIRDDLKFYTELRGNAISKVDQKIKQLNLIFDNPNIGSTHLNYFDDTKYGKLSKNDQNSDQDIELSTHYFRMVQDSTNAGELSNRPCNTKIFFDLLENQLKSLDGYKNLRKEIKIGSDKLLSTAYDKINRSNLKEGNEPQFYNLIKDLKRFTLNFINESDLIEQTKYLASHSLFGENLKKEISLQTQIINKLGNQDNYNYLIHVKCIKNSFALKEYENTQKDIKIIFEVKILENSLVFQVELQCNLIAFADWKAIDHVFQDITQQEDAFNQLKSDYNEFLWQESNDRTFVIFCLNLIWIMALYLIYSTTLCLENQQEQNETDNPQINKNLGLKHQMTGSRLKSLQQFEKIEKLYYSNQDNFPNEDLQLYSKILIENSEYDKAIKLLKLLVFKDNKNLEQNLLLAKIYLEYKSDYLQAIKYSELSIKIDPLNIKANLQLGKSQFGNKLQEKAISQFENVIKINPEDSNLLLTIINLLYNAVDIDASNLQFQDFLVLLFKKDIKINPKNINTQLNMGKADLIRRNYEKALEMFKKVNEIDPRNVEVFNFILSQFDKSIIENNATSNDSFDFIVKWFDQLISHDSGQKDLYFNMGKDYYVKLNQEYAIRFFKLAIKIDPNNKDAQLSIGESQLIQDKYQKAIKYFIKAIEIDPEDRKPLNSINDWFMEKFEFDKLNINDQFAISKVYLAQNKYSNVIEYLNKVLEIEPRNEEALIMISQSQFSDNKQKESILQLEKAIVINPSNIDIYLSLGKSQLADKKQIEAIEQFEKVITIDPNNIQSYQNIGKIQISEKKYTKAIVNFKKVIEIDPNNINAQMMIGESQNRLKIQDLAIKAFYDLIKIDPKNTIAFKLLEKNVNIAIELNPKNENAFLNMGFAELEIENQDNAIFLFKKVIQISPKNTKSYISLEKLYYDKKQYNDAIQIIENLISIDRKNIVSQLKILKSQYVKNKQDIAIELIDHEKQLNPYYVQSQDSIIHYNEKLIDKDPKNFNGYQNLGKSQIGLKNQDLAIKQFKKTIEINPKYLDAYLIMGKAQIFKQEFDRANKIFENAFDQVERIIYYKKFNFEENLS